jgi:hypothetical protein
VFFHFSDDYHGFSLHDFDKFADKTAMVALVLLAVPVMAIYNGSHGLTRNIALAAASLRVR